MIQGKISYEELLDGDKIILNKKAYNWSPEWQIGSRISMLIEDGGRQIPKTFVVAAIAEPPVYLNFYAPLWFLLKCWKAVCKQSDVPLVHPDGTGQLKAAEAQLRQMLRETSS